MPQDNSPIKAFFNAMLQNTKEEHNCLNSDELHEIRSILKIYRNIKLVASGSLLVIVFAAGFTYSQYLSQINANKNDINDLKEKKIKELSDNIDKKADNSDLIYLRDKIDKLSSEKKEKP